MPTCLQDLKFDLRQEVMNSTSSSLQSVLVGLVFHAVNMADVMMDTWVTVLAPATEVLGAWPVNCVVMGSMEPPANVSTDDNFLFDATHFMILTVFLIWFSACNCSEHGSCDSGRRGTGACFCEAGWTGEHCETQQGEFI